MIKNWHKMPSGSEFATLGAMSTVSKPLLFFYIKVTSHLRQCTTGNRYPLIHTPSLDARPYPPCHTVIWRIRSG